MTPKIKIPILPGDSSTKGETMIFEKTYSGLVTSLKIVSKAIKGPEDEKIQKRVGIIKIENDYNTGDLSKFIDGPVPDDFEYDSVSWGERLGEYNININDIDIPVKVIKIDRKNKSDSMKFSLTFETEALTNLSTVGNYVKDKDNPTQFKLSWLQK